jgi:DNA-binding transcriptional LysR family regulator
LKPSLDNLALFAQFCDAIEGRRATSLSQVARDIKRAVPYVRGTLKLLTEDTRAGPLFRQGPLQLTREGRALWKLVRRLLETHEATKQGLLDEVIVGGTNVIGRQLFAGVAARCLREDEARADSPVNYRFVEYLTTEEMVADLIRGVIDCCVTSQRWAEFYPRLHWEELGVSLDTVLLAPTRHRFRDRPRGRSGRPSVRVQDLTGEVVCVIAADKAETFKGLRMEPGGRLVVADHYSTLFAVLRQVERGRGAPAVAVVGKVGNRLFESEGIREEDFFLCDIEGLDDRVRLWDLSVCTIADPTTSDASRPASPLGRFLSVLKAEARGSR